MTGCPLHPIFSADVERLERRPLKPGKGNPNEVGTRTQVPKQTGHVLSQKLTFSFSLKNSGWKCTFLLKWSLYNLVDHPRSRKWQSNHGDRKSPSPPLPDGLNSLYKGVS